jgi:predicted transcriptional regulator
MLIRCLAQTLRDERSAAGIKRTVMAVALDRSESAVANFETGRSLMRDLDTVVQTYANMLRVRPQDLWAKAWARTGWKSDAEPS